MLYLIPTCQTRGEKLSWNIPRVARHLHAAQCSVFGNIRIPTTGFKSSFSLEYVFKSTCDTDID